MRPVRTYLASIDSSAIDLATDEVAARVRNIARIFASAGEDFGPGGETRPRFNFAMPRQILEEDLGRLDDAIEDLQVEK